MSDYTTEAEVSVDARRRRRRSLVVLAVVLLGLFFAFWYALSYYRADNTARAGRPPGTCSPYDPQAVTPASTKVNVYNASNRNGLAGSVSKSLAERGFVIGKVANDPSKRKAPAVAEIRHGKAGEAQAKLLRTSLPKGTTIVVDKRKGTGVDVALGAKFTNLPPAPTATALPMCPAPSDS